MEKLASPRYLGVVRWESYSDRKVTGKDEQEAILEVGV